MFPNKKKFRFPNPLHQNYRHVRAICEVLNIDERNVHSIVMFIGDGVRLKTDLPPQVLVSPYQAAKYMRRFSDVVFSDAQLWQFENTLYGLNAAQVSNREHVENLQARYAQRDTCPKCGSAMVQRIAKRGRNIGSTFWACSAYPKCKYIDAR